MARTKKKLSVPASSLSTKDLADLIIKSVDSPNLKRLKDFDKIDSDINEFITTQAKSLDYAIGRNGIPVGRLTTIVGADKSGKSTLCQHIIAETQKMGGLAYLLDTEASFDLVRANNIGINIDDLLWINEETVESAIDLITDTLNKTIEAGSPFISCIVMDSISALSSEAELKKGADESAGMALHSKALSRWFRSGLPGLLSKARCALVMVNQEREKIGSASFFGPSKTYLGEKPQGFHTSLELTVRNAGTLGSNKDEPIGIKSHIKVTRSKVAAPLKAVILENYFETGFNIYQSELDFLIRIGAIESKGSWLKYGESSFYAKDWVEKREECPELTALTVEDYDKDDTGQELPVD